MKSSSIRCGFIKASWSPERHCATQSLLRVQSTKDNYVAFCCCCRCTFSCSLLILFQLLPLSTAPSDAVFPLCQPNVCRMCEISVCVWDAVCSCEWAVWWWWQRELCQDCSPHSWSSASLKGLGRTKLEGPGDGGERVYLSPRIAYWLSSCKCCIEAPLVSSLPRFLCFTTSKVFSISLSLRVSTCLAVASREGNCASL